MIPKDREYRLDYAKLGKKLREGMKDLKFEKSKEANPRLKRNNKKYIEDIKNNKSVLYIVEKFFPKIQFVDRKKQGGLRHVCCRGMGYRSATWLSEHMNDDEPNKSACLNKRLKQKKEALAMEFIDKLGGLNNI